MPSDKFTSKNKNAFTPIRNKKALSRYEIIEEFEAGIVLTGPEIKSIRNRQINFVDSYCTVKNNELWIIGLHIAPYRFATGFSAFDPMRKRKLLLKKHEIGYLKSKVEAKTLTIVPISIYFKHGFAKIAIALAKGKKLYDKRQDLIRKQQNLDAAREIKHALRTSK